MDFSHQAPRPAGAGENSERGGILAEVDRDGFWGAVEGGNIVCGGGGGGGGRGGGGDDNMSGSKTSKTSVICVELNDKGMLIIEAVALYWLLAHKIIAQ